MSARLWRWEARLRQAGVTVDDFDPQEPRDADGKWTKAGAGKTNTSAEWEEAFGPGPEPSIHEIHQTRIHELNAELAALGKLEDEFNALLKDTIRTPKESQAAQIEFNARVEVQAARVQAARDAVTAAWQAIKAEEAKMHAEGVRVVVADVARQMDFPAADINFREDSYTFQLNGKTLQAAGLAYLDTGKIDIFPHAVKGVREAEGVMAHEVGHQIFESVVKETGLQRRAAMGTPPQMITTEGGSTKMGSILKPDGTLRESHAEMLPIFAEMGRYDNMGQQLHDEDGVSEYSRDWWAAFDNGTANAHQAQHETFAEITRIVFESQRDTGKMWGSDEAQAVGRIWKQYFTSINRANKKIRA